MSVDIAARPDGQRFNMFSLFSGVGGLDLGARRAIGSARVVGHAERDPACQRVLLKRMAAGDLDRAPICTDIRELDGAPWAGRVDCLIGGFPCQDISVAGNQAGILEGKQSGLWFEFARVIREMGPGWIFVENVDALVTLARQGKGLDVVLGSMADLGFDAEWGVLSAACVGAPHGRPRIFILAAAPGARPLELAHPNGIAAGPHGTGGPGADVVYPPGPDDDWTEWLRRHPGTEPVVWRANDGVHGGVDISWADRWHIIGNAVVADGAALAFRILYRRLWGG